MVLISKFQFFLDQFLLQAAILFTCSISDSIMCTNSSLVKRFVDNPDFSCCSCAYSWLFDNTTMTIPKPINGCIL
jgi:hypothetical protein